MLNMNALQLMGFSDFIDILFNPENIFQAVGEAVSKIADFFDILQFNITIHSSNMPDVNETIFDKYSENEAYEIKTFNFGNSDSMMIDIDIKIKSSRKFSEEDNKNLECFAKIIYTFVSKEKCESIVANAGMIDIKTGLLTINGFERNLAKMIKTNRHDNHSIVFMNVKDFKIINRRYGHEEGNKVMSKICRKIKIFLNDDSFFAHLGGDNFVVYINNTYLNIFLKMITKFPIDIQNKNGQTEEYCITFHAGVCQFSDISSKSATIAAAVSHIIENSQIAMNIAKRNATLGNIVYYDEKVKQMIMHEKEIESSMRTSLENGDFIVCYQPKVNLQTYEMNSAEALVRWKKNGQILPPAAFIPVFEKNGFVCEIDFYVLDVVCKKIRSWIEKGIEPVKVSVNFSKLHTENPNLVNDITDVIVKNGILPKYVEIEFTESSYIDSSNQIKDIIVKLKEVGIMVSMDDFGTGYSSLNMLKEMPIDILKLDKSFLNADGTMSKREEIIIKNVIRMAKELDIEVVSEGVETLEHVKFLQNLECDMAQGYFFDKPLFEEAYETRLKHIVYDDQKNNIG